MSTPINDGGPAFHVADTLHAKGQVQYGFNGMTLRDWFAGQALPTMLHDWCESDPRHFEAVALNCYKLADFMLAARERKEGGK